MPKTESLLLRIRLSLRRASIEENGQAIDSSGALPDGTQFNGALELVDLLSKSPDAARCMIDHFAGYALGVPNGTIGRCNITSDVFTKFGVKE